MRVSSGGISSKPSRAWLRNRWWSETAPPTAARGTRCSRRCGPTHASVSTRPATRTAGAAVTPSTTRWFAEQARKGLAGHDEFAWRARGRAELDNLRGAIVWALESSLTTDAQLGLRIVAALVYEAVSDMTSGVSTWTERAIARVDEATPGQRTAILGTAAIQAIFVGDHELARTLALDALRDGLPPDCPVPVPAYSALGSYELKCSRPDEALRIIRRGLHDVEAGGFDTYTLSNFHSILAVFSTYCGDITTARAEAEEALRLARQVGNPSASASALWAAGRALVRADPSASLAAFEGYVALARSGGRSSNLGWSLGDVSWLKARRR